MKIAFASCTNLDHYPEQTVWADIAAQQPDYLFLLGDNIYMDFWPKLGEPEKWPVDRFEREMRQRYTEQWAQPHFAALLAQVRQRQGQGGGVYGTWDDHDFAWDDANGRHVELAKKRIAARLFAEFMQTPVSDNGIQHAVPLHHAGQPVGKAIFLDTRWHRDEPGDHNDLLGEDQFRFLQAELLHPLPLTLICAGTPQRRKGAGWAGYKRDLLRFRQLLGKRKTIMLSGDLHENEFNPPSGDTEMYEIVSSGAAVKKAKLIGKRRNHGLLDWTPQRTRITLFDKRGSQAYQIDNAGWGCEELDP